MKSMGKSKMAIQSLQKIKKVVELLNTIEAIYINNEPFGDMGGKILGLGLLKNTKLLYMNLSIIYKQQQIFVRLVLKV